MDRTTLGTILDAVEEKHGKARRVWVFDRGIVSEDNLALLRARGAHYLVGTPKRKLQAYEQKLLDGPWIKASAEVDVQLVPEHDEIYVLCRSAGRKAKEQAMRRRWVRGLLGDLRALRRRVAHGQLKNPDLIQQTIGRLSERHPQAWRWITVGSAEGAVRWTWDREAFRRAVRTEGAYLLRAHWTEKDPAKLWQTYVQLTEAEAAFRTLKTDLKVRPLWHWTEPRVAAHLLVAFLGYCLWVYLKKCCARAAPSLTPWTLLDQLRRIVLVEVWFELRRGGTICLPRITQPEPAQAALLAQLDWTLPAQPPPRIYPAQAGDAAIGATG
jgi:transposase